MRIGFAFACLLASCAGIAHSQTKYTIKLTRPATEGQRYIFTAVGMSEKHMTMHGKAERQKKTSLHVMFEAEAKVLKTGRRQQASKLALTIKRFIKHQDGEEIELVQPGRVVVADDTDGSGTKYYVGSEKAVGEVFEALRLLVGSLKTRGATDDDVFGSQKDRAVGESWHIDRAVAVRDWADTHGITIKPSGLTGTVKLESIGTVGRIKCMKLTSVLTAQDFKLKLPLPPEASLVNPSVTGKMSGQFPLDLRLPPLVEEFHLTMMFTIQARPKSGAAPRAIKVSATRSVTWKRTPLP